MRPSISSKTSSCVALGSKTLSKLNGIAWSRTSPMADSDDWWMVICDWPSSPLAYEMRATESLAPENRRDKAGISR